MHRRFKVRVSLRKRRIDWFHIVGDLQGTDPLVFCYHRWPGGFPLRRSK